MSEFTNCIKCGAAKPPATSECPECGSIYAKAEAIWTKKKDAPLPPPTASSIHFKYRDAEGNKTERTVSSACKFKHNGKDYIYGHCKLRNEQRNFLADRIIGDIIDEQTGEVITTDKLFSISKPEEWENDSAGGQDSPPQDIAGQQKSFLQRYREASYRNTPICTHCGTISAPKLYTKGSIFLELFLWLLFIIPGLIYSIWRHASRYKGCPKCGAPNMIPQDSPMAQKLLKP